MTPVQPSCLTAVTSVVDTAGARVSAPPHDWRSRAFDLDPGGVDPVLAATG